ncbi:hypothetical protein AB6735_07590 [Mucilaginibacter sp. RCC_168]|uniref:hypothetical protein n=1 Tax=Mucilaginibacter sp. RCC_168 TaxID=3239221 RepID=UPI003523DD6D
MKQLICPAGLLAILLTFGACKSRQPLVAGNPGTQPNVNPVRLDLSKGLNIDYGSLTNGYARSNDVFMVEVTGYNPLKYRIGATTTGLVTFQNSASPVIAYTTITAPTATTQVAPGAAPDTSAALVAADVTKLRSIILRITTTTPKINNDIKTISDFLNILADYQNTIDRSWKKIEQLTSATIQTEQKKIYNRLGNLINDYFPPGTNNPYQPTLGTTPACQIDYYMITDFPVTVNNDLTKRVDEYKLALNDLTAFETAHAADIKGYARQVGISDYDSFKSDFKNSLAATQSYQTDFTTTQQPKLAPFAVSVTDVAALQYSTLVGPFTLQQNDEITIKFSKTDLVTNTDALSTFPGIIIKRRGGAKIDFSAGLFFSGLNDKSYVASQTTRITQDSTVENGTVVVKPNQSTFSSIKQRSGANFSYGPMAFMHFHSMTAGPFNYGAFIGTGFMFKDNAKPVLAVGANFMIANFQRVVFGVGGAWGSVTRLSSKYQENVLYRETITDVTTESHLDFKGMFSISWNLSK